MGLPDFWTLGSADLSKSLAVVESFFRAQAWEPPEAKGSALYTGKETSKMSFEEVGRHSEPWRGGGWQARSEGWLVAMELTRLGDAGLRCFADAA